MKDQKKKLVMSSEIFLLKAIRSASNTGKKSSEDILELLDPMTIGIWSTLLWLSNCLKEYRRLSSQWMVPKINLGLFCQYHLQTRQTKWRILWMRRELRRTSGSLVTSAPDMGIRLFHTSNEFSMCMCHCRAVWNAISWSQAVICDVHGIYVEFESEVFITCWCWTCLVIFG